MLGLWLVLFLAFYAQPVTAAVGAVSPPAATYLRGYRAGFKAPTRLATDSAGNFYVTDPQQGAIVVRDRTGHIVAHPAGGLRTPLGIAVDGLGTIYVGDMSTGSVTVLGGDWQVLRTLGQGGGEFLMPNDIAVEAVSGNIYVTDSKANLVKVYSAAGAPVGSFGGTGSSAGRFNFPTGIFVDSAAGQVFVVDQLNFRVQVFDLNGAFVSTFGSHGGAPGQFNMAQGIWVDPQGLVYVADSFQGWVQVLDRNGNFVRYVGDFGEGPGRLRLPMDVVIDSSNRLVVSSAENARLEMFGMSAYADPESVVPAVVVFEPNPLGRSESRSAVVGYLEVPGYPLDQVVASTIVANGVAANVSSISLGDHDGNGVPDLRIEFDWNAFLATLPLASQATIVVSGTIGSLQFEGSQVIQITACGPATVCTLGNADPQCNEAVCVEPTGCTVQAKGSGTACNSGNACTANDTCNGGVCVAGSAISCDDGNVCTGDACSPASGCVHSNNTAACNDENACTTNDTCGGGVCAGGPPLNCNDGNVCTDDTCDPATGCAHVNNTAPCNDGDACTTRDRCNAGGCLGGPPPNCNDGNVCTDDSCNYRSGCVHGSNSGACDDGNPGTIHDTCYAGQCSGYTVTGMYTILKWTPAAAVNVGLSVGWVDRIQGDVCTDTIQLGAFARLGGDAVATQSSGPAVSMDYMSRVTGNVVTGGGAVAGPGVTGIAGRSDTSGLASELQECAAASFAAKVRREEFARLPANPALALGVIQQPRLVSRPIPKTGTLGAGRIVIDATSISLGNFAKLILVGGPKTEQVIVRVRASLLLSNGASILLQGLAPEQVIFVVDGPVTMKPRASIRGTVFAKSVVSVDYGSTVNGAIVAGGGITLNSYVTVEPHPFAGW